MFLRQTYKAIGNPKFKSKYEMLVYRQYVECEV